MQFIVLGDEAFLIISEQRRTNGKRLALLFDCGVSFGEWPEETHEIIKERHKRMAYGPNLDLIPEDVEVVAAIASHAHLDHIGYFPRLEKENKFARDAKVFGTAQTNKLLEWHYKESKRLSPYLFNGIHVIKTLARRKDLPLGEIRIHPDFHCYVFPSGHLPGAISLIVKTPEGKNYCLVGDRSWHNQATVKGAGLFSELPREWLPDSFLSFDPFSLFGEPYDYQARLETIRKTVKENPRSRFLFAVLAIARGPNVTIGALLDSGLPIYFDGGTRETSQVLAALQSSDLDIPISFKGIRFVGSYEERVQLAQSEEPTIVVTSAGMEDAGAIATYLPYFLPREDWFYVVTSHLPRGSKGEEILTKSRLSEPQMVMIGEREVALRCKVIDGRVSAHGDYMAACYDLDNLVKTRGKKLENFIVRVPQDLGNQMVTTFLREHVAERFLPAYPGMILKL